jgi:heme/copper-type cytochrome/quinol oxidase subunit 4
MMRYIVAWLLGVPFSVIAVWYVVGHAACGH